MKYFGIKTPRKDNEDSYIWWISNSEHKSWDDFFSYPDKTNNYNPHRVPLDEAKKAYQSIGYKCVELEVTEIE